MCGYVCKLAYKAGADVNKLDNNYQTPLLATALTGNCSRAKLLLKAGTLINKQDNMGDNALIVHLEECEPIEENSAMLLYAAGETLNDVNYKLHHAKIPDILKDKDLQRRLKHLYREAIRNHLIKLDPHSHLFRRIPQLGLPSSLTAYILYYISLDS